MPEATRIIGTQLLIFLIFSAVFFTAIIAVMITFVIRYRRSRHPVPADISGNPLLEALWIAIPVLLVLGMFTIGLRGYLFMRHPPAGAMEVKVVAFQFGWEFEYPNGAKEAELTVPAGKAIVLRLTSMDVIHSFFVPDFLIKQDAVPAMTTTLWFEAPEPGEHDVLCAEYCGVGHSDMLTKLRVIPQVDFDAWYKEEEAKEAPKN